MTANYRHTKVVFTAGPATANEEVMEQLIREGVSVCRINMAHADAAATKKTVDLVRKSCEKVGRDISILMDVKGPEIRTGVVGDEPIQLKKGDKVDFYVDQTAIDDHADDSYAVTVNYPGIVNDIEVGQVVLVDSGLIRMKVLEIQTKRVRCEVLIPDSFGNRRHINLPGVKVGLPALTSKDEVDIKTGIENKVEFFALSFVREAEDIRIMRRYITSLGSKAKIIAKIEDQTAIRNLSEIIEESDGLMVARGDLGIEIPFEDLPSVQLRAINICHEKKKPVIVATHMLESMIEKPVPTRAEVSDIANAVYQKADSVMLSGETATGDFPLDCVQVMHRIASKTEHELGLGFNEKLAVETSKDKLIRSAVSLATEMGGVPLITFTRNGDTAQLMSSLRPGKCPIYAFTDDEIVHRQMKLMWGVVPFLTDFDKQISETVSDVNKQLIAGGWCKQGAETVMVISSLVRKRMINSVRLNVVE